MPGFEVARRYCSVAGSSEALGMLSPRASHPIKSMLRQACPLSPEGAWEAVSMQSSNGAVVRYPWLESGGPKSRRGNVVAFPA